jgi:hypothetical protein
VFSKGDNYFFLIQLIVQVVSKGDNYILNSLFKCLARETTTIILPPLHFHLLPLVELSWSVILQQPGTKSDKAIKKKLYVNSYGYLPYFVHDKFAKTISYIFLG